MASSALDIEPRREEFKRTVTNAGSLGGILGGLIDGLDGEYGLEGWMGMRKVGHDDGPGNGALVIVVVLRVVEFNLGSTIPCEHLAS